MGHREVEEAISSHLVVDTFSRKGKMDLNVTRASQVQLYRQSWRLHLAS